MAQYACFGMRSLQTLQEQQQRLLLCLRARVGTVSLGIESAFVANAERMLVEALCVGTCELFVACLVDMAVAGYIIMIAREAEPVTVAAYELQHREGAVGTCGRTMYDNQIDLSHSFSLSHHAALYEERADDGGEHRNGELDDGFPLFHNHTAFF